MEFPPTDRPQSLFQLNQTKIERHLLGIIFDQIRPWQHLHVLLLLPLSKLFLPA